EGGPKDAPYFVIVPFFGIFVTIGFGMLGIGLRSKTGFPILFGGVFGGMPLLLSLALLGTVSLYTLVPCAILMVILGLRLGGRPSWRNAFRDGSGGGRGGGSSSGWVMGGGSSSGSSSSSSSSSSSNYGGGSSGGGGASGSW
ncbi:MAG: hypothetical protein ABI039_08895, partial [Vicinamibacterales bacterium]